MGLIYKQTSFKKFVSKIQIPHAYFLQHASKPTVDLNHTMCLPRIPVRHLSPPFHPFAHKPPDQLRRLLRLPLRTSHPQGSVERGHARLRRGQRRQLVLVRAALGRSTATTAGHGRRRRCRCRQMMMVVVVVQVVIVHAHLTEPMMMMMILVKIVVIVHGRSSGSSRRRQVHGGGYLMGLLLLLLQLSRVLYDIVLLRWLLLLQ